MTGRRYDGQNVSVLGLGATGRSLVRFLHARGARVSVHDEGDRSTRDGLPEDVPLIRCDGMRDRLPGAIDWVALSPGFPRARPIVEQALASGRPVLGDVEIFARHLPSEAQVIAITGSNGKSTTTALAGELARLRDPGAQVAGNIGEPVLDALTRAPSTRTWVLELSSFQLESTESLRPAAATVLNVTANHLDRYDSLFAYAAAKASIHRGAERKVVNRDCPWSSSMVAADASARRRFGLGTPEREDDYGLREDSGDTLLVQGDRSFCAERDLRLAGRHQVANALAALALAEPRERTWSSDSRAAAADVLRRFRGLPHRTSLLATVDGVRLIDDSKATSEAATLAALSGLAAPTHLIAGGDAKGQRFDALGPAIARHCRGVYLIGRDAPLLRERCAVQGVAAEIFPSLEAATEQALDRARPGEIVLLSPACASWDMFANYVERARAFGRAAEAWAAARGRVLVPPGGGA